MTDSVVRQSAAGLGAPFPQYREPPEPPPKSTPPPRRAPRVPRNLPSLERLRQRHVRTHGGRRRA